MVRGTTSLKKNEFDHERKIIGIFHVNYKQYFTLYPQGKDIKTMYAQIIRFLETIPEIYDKSLSLARRTQDRIRFKLPGSLRLLANHPDSFIVYHNKKELGTRIQAGVIKLFGQKGVHFQQRKNRSQNGFDFKEKEVEKNMTGESHSHSELVAQAMSKRIKENQERFKHFSKAQWEAWLITAVKELDSWDEEKMHQYLF